MALEQIGESIHRRECVDVVTAEDALLACQDLFKKRLGVRPMALIVQDHGQVVKRFQCRRMHRGECLGPAIGRLAERGLGLRKFLTGLQEHAVIVQHGQCQRVGRAEGAVGGGQRLLE